LDLRFEHKSKLGWTNNQPTKFDLNLLFEKSVRR
jgi:hypothetical protein